MKIIKKIIATIRKALDEMSPETMAELNANCEII